MLLPLVAPSSGKSKFDEDVHIPHTPIMHILLFYVVHIPCGCHMYTFLYNKLIASASL